MSSIIVFVSQHRRVVEKHLALLFGDYKIYTYLCNTISNKQRSMAEDIFKLYSGKFLSNSEIMASYLKDIRKYTVPTKEEEQELFKRYKNGDSKALDEIILRNQRFVFALAKIYSSGRNDVLDYVNEGNIGLYEAVRKYNPASGNKFTSYAVFWIRRYMSYFAENTNRSIKQSNATKYRSKISKIREDFIKENGFEPSDEQIIDELKEKYNIEVHDPSDIYKISTFSIDAPLQSDKADGAITNEGGMEFASATSSDNDYLDKMNREDAEKRVNDFLKPLSKRHKKIIMMLYGIGYKRAFSPSEVADIMGMSDKVVTQLRTSLLRKMRNAV